MTKHLCIIGGGHAGSSAALAAAKLQHDHAYQHALEITLLERTGNLGIRPRYYEYELAETQIALSELLQPLGVKVIAGEVNFIDYSSRTITYTDSAKKQTLNFDSLVIASGSQLEHPPTPGIAGCHNIDSYKSALKFNQALEAKVVAQEAIKIAVLGAGLTGIELACELPITLNKIAQQKNIKAPNLEIKLFDRNEIIYNLGDDPAPYIQEALNQAKISCVNHATITEVKESVVHYNSEQPYAADLIVSTLGLRANPLAMSQDLQQDNLGRIVVNEFLAVSALDNVFVAGDAAQSMVDSNHHSIMSCQQGRPQGRYAGYNAVASLFNKTMQAYTQPNYVTCVDLGAYGAIFTEGWDRKVKSFGQEAKKLKQHINQDRIYPPMTGELDDLLHAGELEFISPSTTIKDPSN